MVFLPTHKVELYETVNDSSKLDNYDQPTVTKDVKVGEAMGNFQPMSPGAARKEFGTKMTGMYRLFLSPTVMVKKNYKFKVDGFDGFFEVYGEPIIRPMLGQQKVALMRVG